MVILRMFRAQIKILGLKSKLLKNRYNNCISNCFDQNFKFNDMKHTFLLIAFLIVSTVTYAQNNNNNSVPLITVNGESSVKIKPDEVTLNFGVETRNLEAKAAKTENDKMMSEILKYLKAQKIDPKNIQTDYLRLNPVYNHQLGKEEGFVAVQMVSLKITDLAKYETISAGLIERGINQINNIEFASSKIKEHEAEARNLAIKSAKEKATAMASQMDQKIGKAYYINEDMQPVIPFQRYGAMKAMDMQESGGNEPTIAPGEIEIKGRVTVSFVLM